MRRGGVDDVASKHARQGGGMSSLRSSESPSHELEVQSTAWAAKLVGSTICARFATRPSSSCKHFSHPTAMDQPWTLQSGSSIRRLVRSHASENVDRGLGRVKCMEGCEVVADWPAWVLRVGRGVDESDGVWGCIT